MSEFVVHGGGVYLKYTHELHMVLPHADVIDMPSGQVLRVPHGTDEVRVLKNMGVDLGAEILHAYDWCGGKPFATQSRTAAFITMNPRCFVTSGMGVGKTAALLYAFDWLRTKKQAKRLLVVAPLSTLNPTWRREVLLRTPHLNVQVLRGTKAQRLSALSIPADIYIINHDGLKVVLEELLKRNDIDMVVADEITAYKNSRSERSKVFAAVSKTRKRVVGMTGTPAGNHITDAYGQIKAVLQGAFKMGFTSFRETTCKRSGPFKWVARPESIEVVARMYQPAIRFTRDETYDLPPVTYIDRDIELTPSQVSVLKELRDEGAAILKTGNVLGVNEAALLGKMMQVILGGVYGTDHKIIKVDAQPRYTELMNVLEEVDGKVLIFSTFKESVKQLAEVMREEYTVGVINGDVPASQRDEIFNDFQHGSLKYIVAHPQTMSHGLTLTSAATIIWFGPPGSLETYLQANARIIRMGQTKNQLIVRFVASKLEQKIYARFEKKEELQGLLLDFLQDLGD